MMQLSFFGAVGTVTGSRYLIRAGAHALLVDCGLFQGLKQLRLRNRAPFPVPPESVSAVILTHAHLDHSGYLPLFVRNGFHGPVYCSAATAALCRVLLVDAAHLEEEGARLANRQGYSRHHPALPLFTMQDAQRALELLTPAPFEQDTPIPGIGTFRLRGAGHILGAASVAVTHQDCTVLFSGDLGQSDDPVMKAPVAWQTTDYLVVESTYGDEGMAPENRSAGPCARSSP